MRGSLDLSNHKLVGAFKPPAPRTYPTKIKLRARREDAVYRQIWRIADGAVRDALANHPEYLTVRGKQMARAAIVKRVSGSLYGYATQVAQGRSVAVREHCSAADGAPGAFVTPGLMAFLTSRVRLWWLNYWSPRNSAGAA